MCSHARLSKFYPQQHSLRTPKSILPRTKLEKPSFALFKQPPKPCRGSNMSSTAACYDRLRKPTQLDLSRIDPASFVNIDLPTRRVEVSPPPPPSSPRAPSGQQDLDASDIKPGWPLVQGHWPANPIYDTELSICSFYQSSPSMSLQLPNPQCEERSVSDFQSESCVSEINSTAQVDLWSQCCSSSSEGDAALNNKGSSLMTTTYQHSQDLDDLSNIRGSEWPAQTTFSYPTERRVSLPSLPPKLESPVMLPSTLRARQTVTSHMTGPGPYTMTQSDAGFPPPHPFASQNVSHPCTSMTQAYPDLNEHSFMDFDDSESEVRGKHATKASSLSRLFDQKRKGHHRKGFGRSLSDVFSTFSCAK